MKDAVMVLLVLLAYVIGSNFYIHKLQRESAELKRQLAICENTKR